MGSDHFIYDANGNQITRHVGGHSYTLTYDVENRLVGVSGYPTATFVFDGDGNRVKGTISGTTTVYIGNPSVPSGQCYFEWKTNTSDMKKYYYAGTTRVAMRTGGSTVNYLLGDHLGSQAITTNTSGTRTGEIRYYPWGTERYTWGTTPTMYHYTGQRLESGLGLYFYGARWYDPAAGRFLSPDTVIPGLEGTNVPATPQAWDRYTYTSNNPVKYTDPSGHRECDIQCQEEYEAVDPIAIHYGEAYQGDCWGAQDCLGDAILWDGGGTISLGGGGQIFSPISGLRGNLDVAIDGKGNLAIQATIGGGGYLGLGFSNIGPSLMVTNAPDVKSLNGASAQFGGGVLIEGGGVGADHVFGKDHAYEGYAINAGISGGIPAEGHATVTGTFTLAQINIFDAIIYISNWLK